MARPEAALLLCARMALCDVKWVHVEFGKDLFSARSLREYSLGDYRKLEVWRRAAQFFSNEIVNLVHRLPLNDRIRIGRQICRAAESIRFNLSEGCGLNTDPLLANHVRRALGSANEVDDQLDSLCMRGRLKDRDRWLIDEIRQIRSMLAGFLHRLEADIARNRRPRRRPSSDDSKNKGAAPGRAPPIR